MNGSDNSFSTKFTLNIELHILVHLISLAIVIIDSSKLQLLENTIMMMNEKNYHISLILLWQFSTFP